MNDVLETLREWAENPSVRAGVRAFLIVVAGFLVARVVRRRIHSGLAGQDRLLASRVVGAIIYGVSGAWALSELGMSLSVLLGAAGVLTIAVGFAAQTAVSNLISGLFLIVERPFRIGDVIEVSQMTGEVVTIDLMSTKLRTFDNLLVRIPNEVLLKASVTNLSHFPIRRVDVQLRLAEETDLKQFTALFESESRSILACLDEPAPSLLVMGFDEAGVLVRLSVWAATEDYISVKNEFQTRMASAVAKSERGFAVPRRKLIMLPQPASTDPPVPTTAP